MFGEKIAITITIAGNMFWQTRKKRTLQEALSLRRPQCWGIRGQLGDRLGVVGVCARRAGCARGFGRRARVGAAGRGPSRRGQRLCTTCCRGMPVCCRGGGATKSNRSSRTNFFFFLESIRRSTIRTEGGLDPASPLKRRPFGLQAAGCAAPSKKRTRA